MANNPELEALDEKLLAVYRDLNNEADSAEKAALIMKFLYHDEEHIQKTLFAYQRGLRRAAKVLQPLLPPT